LIGLLYTEHKLTMFKAAYNILEDEHLAEDAVHNAFENISRHLERSNNPQSIQTTAYLITVTQNAAKKIYNKRKPLQNQVDIHENEYRLRNVTDTESEVMGKLSKERFLSCLQKMAPKYRDVLLMKYYMQKSDKEIAAALELSSSAVRKRLERARKDLIKRYGGENSEA